jgi:glucosyl-dolichyl phosphate glucuronosyltransferase
LENVEISVVVPTRNRVGLLGDTLASLAVQTLPRERYEVVVVDNGSTDETAALAEDALRRDGVNGRCVIEPALGANLARNRGVATSRGRIVAFLDDDARAEPDWLEALLAAFAGGATNGVGGRIDLVWDTAPPRWQHRNYLQLLAEFDLGAERCKVERYPYLVSANLAFTRQTFDRFGRFDPRLDRRGSSLLSMGDTEFCHRVVRGGGTLLYEPTAVVRHVVPKDRTRFSFLLRRSYCNGRSLCQLKNRWRDLDAKTSHPALLFNTGVNLLRELRNRNLPGSARQASLLAWHLGYLREALMTRTAEAGTLPD